MRRERKRFAFCRGPCETTGRPERKPILFLTVLHRSRSWVSTVRWDVISLILLFSYSLFLYNLAKSKRSNPPLQVVRSWVDEINKVAKTKLSCTPTVYTTLVQRAQYLTSKLVKLSGGRQRQKVLSTDWSFQVSGNYFCIDRASVDIVSYTLGLSRPTPCQGEAWYMLFVHVRKYSVMFSIKTFVHFLVCMQIILTKRTIQQKSNKLNYQKVPLVATEILTSLRTQLIAAPP